MWIRNNYYSPAMLLNLLIHYFKFVFWELILVKLKVRPVWSIINIYPKVINWETIIFKVLVSLNYNVGGYFSILTKVETK